MPVGTGAITPAVKDPETNPRENGEADGIKMKPARFLPDPAGEVEECQAAVENHKKIVQEYIHFKPFADVYQ